uniref:Uncharacterized protein n=1 Tax=Kalanchoe fedtschenkoi TaxID=63787 RepID=A0A7N0RAC4_KALFE
MAGSGSSSSGSFSRFPQSSEFPFPFRLFLFNFQSQPFPTMVFFLLRSTVRSPRYFYGMRILPSDIWPFFDPICRDVRQNDRVELRKLFEEFANARADLLEFEFEFLETVGYCPDAVRKFKNMLTVLFQGSHYIDKVRARLYDNTFGYIEWLANLIAYNKRVIHFSEFKRQVQDLFRGHPDLWEDFDRNLDRDMPESSSSDESDEEESDDMDAEKPQ